MVGLRLKWRCTNCEGVYHAHLQRLRIEGAASGKPPFLRNGGLPLAGLLKVDVFRTLLLP